MLSYYRTGSYKRKTIFRIGYILIAVSVIFSCKEPFTPAITANSSNILVVEGYINTGADSTFIRLSRTVAVAGENTLDPEQGATVNIESEAGANFLLEETVKGTYAAPPLNLDQSKRYRLKIITPGGASYLSDYVSSKSAPGIDNVVWKAKDDGVNLFVNTHDATDQTRYYRWDYSETWVFYSRFQSNIKWDGEKMVARDMTNDDIYKCWGNHNSSSILLGSTAKLSKDIIFEGPLTFVGSSSEKLQEKYSILVRQYALTKEEYEFWQTLKKNTENLGSIFDAQPSQLTGNIHNVNDPSEPVIGYIGAGSITQQRIFIEKGQLPFAYKTIYPFECVDPPDTIFKDDIARMQIFFKAGAYFPIDSVYQAQIRIGYRGAIRSCVDCTIRGTNKRPAFWQ